MARSSDSARCSRPASWAECWRCSRSLAAPALAVYWLFNRDATIDGQRNWWLALVPGALAIYLVVRWVFIQQSVVIESGRNWSALDESAILTRGSWWRVLGTLLVVGLIELGPIAIAAAIAQALPPLGAAAITSIVFALVIPFPVTAQTLLYYDLKARKQADASADRLPAAESDVQG